MPLEAPAAVPHATQSHHPQHEQQATKRILSALTQDRVSHPRIAALQFETPALVHARLLLALPSIHTVHPFNPHGISESVLVLLVCRRLRQTVCSPLVEACPLLVRMESQPAGLLTLLPVLIEALYLFSARSQGWCQLHAVSGP
eukprot:1393805-Rhodomonas_salina.1